MPSYSDGEYEASWTDSVVTLLSEDGEVNVSRQFLLDAAQIIQNQMYRPIPFPINLAGPVESPESSTTNTLKE